MKKLFFILAFVLVSATLIISCKKSDETTSTLTSSTSNSAVEQAASSLTTSIHLTYFQTTINGGTIENPFELVNDALPGIYRSTMGALDSNAVDSIKNPLLKLRSCLEGLNLSAGQKDSFRHAFMHLVKCKDQTLIRYRGEIAMCMNKFEHLRMKTVMDFRKGLITQAQLKTQLDALKADLQAEIKACKDKESDAFKTCLQHFITEVKSILTEAQFLQLTTCYQS